MVTGALPMGQIPTTRAHEDGDTVQVGEGSSTRTFAADSRVAFEVNNADVERGVGSDGAEATRIGEDLDDKAVSTSPPSHPDAASPRPIRSRNPLVKVYQALIYPIPSKQRTTPRKRDFGFLPIPTSKRHDPSQKPEEQFVFNFKMNFVFALSATISVMNLYYVQPMLVNIANDLGVSYDSVSQVPTLAQGGYAAGIVFITPLGDMIRRRQLVLILFLLTTTVTIGLALAQNVRTLAGLSFIVGMFTVTPQICIPWSADLAPSRVRARAMSITLSGLIFGLVLGRVLAGIISNFSSWRYTYWMAVGLQGAMTIVAWYTLPDTPDKGIGLSYVQVLVSLVKYYFKYPTLTQACLNVYFNSVVFAGFWTTLTFLLSDDPYNYSSLNIGLLGLIGLVGAFLAPQLGSLVDKVVPWLGQLTGNLILLCSMVIALAAAQRSIAAVCISILILDIGGQSYQISSSYRIAGIDPKARARLNACYLLANFVGQTSGTAIMTKIYNTYGWNATGGCAVAFICAGLVVLLSRGPHEAGWVGWSGGTQLLKREKLTDLSPHAVTEKARASKVRAGGASRPQQGPVGGTER